jgi:hypothetical protein
MNPHYIFIAEVDCQRLQTKVNIWQSHGYDIKQSYGVPDHRGMLHVVWMNRTRRADKIEAEGERSAQ